jgi:hypothetical protein
MRLRFTFLFFTFAFFSYVHACQLCNLFLSDSYTTSIDISPRLEWDGNFGYCGEESLISAGLYYGQYISQYDVRAVASKNGPQNKKSSQLLLGINDQDTAAQLHLNVVEWNTSGETSTDQFLSWVKGRVTLGLPVAIGVFTNEYLFYGNTDPNAGDDDYDHIVFVTGVDSSHPDSNYYPDDVIQFSDHGLWGSEGNTPYIFKYSFGAFQGNREQANATNGPIYSLSNNGENYGLAIVGVMDLDGDTLPVSIATDVNYEKPAIINGSNSRPASMPLTLTITVSEVQPGITYNLYKYNKLELIPDSQFNAKASNACEIRQIQILSGSTYSLTEVINSDEVAAYRVVKSTAS